MTRVAGREAVAMVVHLPSLHDALAAPIDDGTWLRARLDQTEREIREYRPDVAEASAIDAPALTGRVTACGTPTAG